MVVVDADELEGPVKATHGPAYFRRQSLQVNLVVPVRQPDGH